MKTAAEKLDRIFEEVANENSDPNVCKMFASGERFVSEPPGSRTLNLLIKRRLVSQTVVLRSN